MHTYIQVDCVPQERDVCVKIVLTSTDRIQGLVALSPDDCRTLSELLLKAAGLTDAYRVLPRRVHEELTNG